MPTKKRTLGGEIDGLREEFADNPSQRGNQFESVFRDYLRTRSDMKDAWRRSDWPDLRRHFRDGKDSGFDLVAEQQDGVLIAIQCKLIAAEAESNIDDVRALTGGSGETLEPFSKLWWVSTGGMTADAAKICEQRKVHIFNLSECWDSEWGVRREPHEPLALQKRAIDKSIRGLSKKGETRGKLIMACGTGKTFVSLKIAERLAEGGVAVDARGVQNVLFAVPSIALASQAMKEWYDNSCRKMSFLAVCSDKGAGANITSERSGEGSAGDSMYPVTTDPMQIAEFLKRETDGDVLRAVFTTYQSIDKVGSAQREHDAPPFHLIIADEAHRTTGSSILGTQVEIRQFGRIHHDAEIRGEKRLYMTASPRIYKTKEKDNETVSITSMDDLEIYGHQLDHVSFREAIEAGILCDYRLICYGIHEDAVETWASDAATRLNIDEKYGRMGKGADEKLILSALSVLLSINGKVRGNSDEEPPGVLSRTLSYASNIRRSKQAKAVLDGTDENAVGVLEKHTDYDDLKNPTVHHVDGTDRITRRREALNSLRYNSSEINPVVITNVKLFGEGIDVPSLDAVALLDPCGSVVDTIQRVGRVMRQDRAGGKKRFGYIIVPIILPPNMSAAQALEQDRGRFKILGDVLNAMQSHADDVIIDWKKHLLYQEPETSGKKDFQPEPTTVEELYGTGTLPFETLLLKISEKFGIGNAKKAVVASMEGVVRQAAKTLMNEGAADKFKRVIGTVSQEDKVVCDIGAVMLVNACLVHKRLDDDNFVPNLPTLASIHLEDDVIGALHEAWTSIMRKDYVQVFNGAAKMIHELRGNKNASQALRQLMTCAENNLKTIVEYGFDHVGMLFNKLVSQTEASSDGAFFTEPAIAQLMMGLLFDENFCDWKDRDAVRNLRVADPTCGSGTLLLASLRAIKKQAKKAQNLSDTEVTALHKHLVENTIYGYDINPYSIQFAASNMTFGAPTADYSNMNLFQVKHGITDNGEARQGSLEFLITDASNKANMKDLFGELAVEAITLSGKVDNIVVAQGLDAVVANPPFTDTSRADTKFEEGKEKMKERLGYIKKNLPVDDVKAIAKMSVRPFFTPLINRMVDKKCGAFGLIVPTTACTAENSAEERRYIASHFDVDFVVTFHCADKVSMSLRTDISESFIVCRRPDGENRPTRFIQLAGAYLDIAKVEQLIASIQSGKTNNLYTEILWSADRMRAGDWSPCQWLTPSLPDAVLRIENLPNLLVSGDHYKWSPDGQGVRGNFRWDNDVKIHKDMPRAEDGNLFRSIDIDIMRTMNAKPETKAVPREGKERAAANHLAKADHVLVATRFSTTSTLLTAVYSERKALGSAFRPIGVFDKRLAKAYTAFLNSSFGVLQLLNRRSKKLSYPAFEAGHLKTLRLPDPAKVDIDAIVRVFEQHKNTPLERLRDCVTDKVRIALDHAIADALGVDRHLTAQWRAWLAKEPSITGKLYEGKLPTSADKGMKT